MLAANQYLIQTVINLGERSAAQKNSALVKVLTREEAAEGCIFRTLVKFSNGGFNTVMGRINSHTLREKHILGKSHQAGIAQPTSPCQQEILEVRAKTS